MRKLKGLVSDGTHNDKIETYKRLVNMLSSYKSLDGEHLNEWIKNDDNSDNGSNGSANKRRRSIGTFWPSYHQASKAENQLTKLADLFNRH